MSTSAPVRARHGWLFVLVPLAVAGPACAALGVILVIDGVQGWHAESLWWGGAWVAAAGAGLAIYVAFALGSRVLGALLLVGSAAAGYVAWVVSHFPYS
jgi:hypothetical protein